MFEQVLGQRSIVYVGLSTVKPNIHIMAHYNSKTFSGETMKNDIKKITVIGAGVMGVQIAARAAVFGSTASLYHYKPEAIEKARHSVISKILCPGRIPQICPINIQQNDQWLEHVFFWSGIGYLYDQVE